MPPAETGETEVERLRAAYDALNGGDAAAALAMLAPDAEWRESGELPGGSTFRGRDAIEAFLTDFLESWERFHQEIEDVAVSGDRIALLIHLTATGRASGADVDAHYAHVWTMREGLGVRVDGFRDQGTALREIGAQDDPDGEGRPATDP